MILDSTQSRLRWRIYFFSLMIVAGLFVLLLTLGYRQLFQGQFWTNQMAQSSTRAVKIPAPRGNILDRKGVVLVDNRPSYNVALYLLEFQAGRNLKKLLSAVRQGVKTLEKRMKGLQMPPVNVNDRVVQVHYDRRGPLPLTVWNDLSPSALAAFEERSPWMHGVDLEKEPVRVYPFGTLACHVLGYVGKPENKNQEEEIDFDSMGRRAFSQPTVVGKSGIEASMDKVLQGVPGLRVIKLNALGFKEAEFHRATPTPGNDVVLSIDQEIQNIVEEAFTGYHGACVILDPRNGDVLAMVSVPSFNPNQFVPVIRKADWRALMEDSQGPLVNRAIQGSYSPGSSFKPIVALAALEGGLVTPSTVIECQGQFYLGKLEFKCWETGGHGNMNLLDAITMSCNVYFYTLGMKLGGPPLWQMARAFGLGQKTGLPLDHEEDGLLGTEQWKRRKNPRDRWTTGDSVNMAIGQGLLNVTPLQMAVMAATLANGGTVYKPRMVLRIETPEGEVVTDFQPEVRNHIPVSPTNIQFVRRAMLNVVENGTGKYAAVSNVKIAGKTGSAQFLVRDPETGEYVKQTRAWMISFAPFQEPRYAMALIVEGGTSGGGTAGPIVGTIYKKIFQLEQERKKPKRPIAIPALPVYIKGGGVEGEVGGELLGEDGSSNASGPSPTVEQEEDEEPPPSSVPASRADIP